MARHLSLRWRIRSGAALALLDLDEAGAQATLGEGEGLGIGLDITDAAQAHLAKLGYDPAFGARPLKRVLQREVVDRVASAILEGGAPEGSTIKVDLVGEEIAIEVLPPVLAG